MCAHRTTVILDAGLAGRQQALDDVLAELDATTGADASQPAHRGPGPRG
jgi:hypothetical protein